MTNQPTIDEMRRVARYMAEVMGLHSAAGKLLAKAAAQEKALKLVVDTLVNRGAVSR